MIMRSKIISAYVLFLHLIMVFTLISFPQENKKEQTCPKQRSVPFIIYSYIIIRLFVNSWGGIRMNPTPFLRLELIQWFIPLYTVFGHAK